MKLFKSCFAAVFFAVFVFAGAAEAQKIKYVTYFPVPYGQHSKINVKELALLATKEDGVVKVGSSINNAAVLSVMNGFMTENFVINSVNSSQPQSGAPDLIVGSVLNHPTGSTYGTLSVTGDVTVGSAMSNLNDINVFDKAYITSVYWDGKGGFGKNSSGGINWPSDCRDLAWEQLKIKGSDTYKTYLTCVPNTIVETPDPGETKIVYVANSKTVSAAKYCETEYYAYWNDWGKEYSQSTKGQKKVRYYEYADQITKKANNQYDGSCTCAAGSMGGSGGMNKPMDYDSAIPWAGAVPGFKQSGQLKLNDYTFTNKYSLTDCPLNLTNQQICDTYCTGIGCNYRCVKTKSFADACGPALETQDCYCPKYNCCGLCENGTGQPACGALGCDMNKCCEQSSCGRTVSCMGSYQGRCGEMVQRVRYEPALGTAEMVYCTATEVPA